MSIREDNIKMRLIEIEWEMWIEFVWIKIWTSGLLNFSLCFVNV
jgi:hypothetical protein